MVQRFVNEMQQNCGICKCVIVAEVDIVDRTRSQVKVSLPEGDDIDTERRTVDGMYVHLFFSCLFCLGNLVMMT